MPPSRPVAQKSHASAQPTCELRHTVYFAVGSASSDAAPPARLRSLQRARRLGRRQRDAHRLDVVSVGEPEQVLHEAVVGLAPLDDLQLGPFACRVQRRRRRVRQPAHRAGGEPGAAVAVDAGEDSPRHVSAHAERRHGSRQLLGVEVAEIEGC